MTFTWPLPWPPSGGKLGLFTLKSRHSSLGHYTMQRVSARRLVLIRLNIIFYFLKARRTQKHKKGGK
jgi:hypothetical protein